MTDWRRLVSWTARIALGIIMMLLPAMPAAAMETETEVAGTYDIEVNTGGDVCFQSTTGTVPVYVRVTGAQIEEISLIKVTYMSQDDIRHSFSMAHEAEKTGNDSAETVFVLNNINVDEDRSYVIPVRIDLLDDNGRVLSHTVERLQAEISVNRLIGGVLTGREDILPVIREAAVQAVSYYSGDIYPSGRISAELIGDTSVFKKQTTRYSFVVVDRKPGEQEAADLTEWLRQGGYGLVLKGSGFLSEKDRGESGPVSFGSGSILFCDPAAFDEGTIAEALRMLCGDSLMGQNPVGLKNAPVYGEDLTTYDAFSPELNMWPYRLILVLFILAAGPAMFIFLKKRDRLEYLWICIPAAACLFAVCIYMAGIPMRAKAPFIRYFKVCRLTDEGSDENMVFSVINPTGSPAVLDAGSLGRVSYEETNYPGSVSSEFIEGALEDDAERVVLVEKDGRSDIMIDPDGLFTRYHFTAAKFNDAAQGQKLSADISYDQGVISGEVTNVSGHDLKEVFVCCCGLYAEIGSIPAGETIHFETQEHYYRYSYQECDVLCRKLAENFEDANTEALIVHIRDFISTQELLPVNYSYVCGFSDENDPDLESMGDAAGMTAYIQQMPVWQCAHDRKNEIGVCAVYADDAAEDGAAQDIYYDYADYPGEYIYRFAADYQPDCIEWLNRENGAVCEWLNIRSGEYETVFADEDMIREDLSDYLDKDHVLHVRYQAGSEYMVPVYAAFGGVLK